MGTTNADLAEKIGELAADVRHSSESRKVMHEKLDRMGEFQLEQVRAITELGEAVKTATHIATQARDLAKGGLDNIHRFETEFREQQLPIITAAQAFKIETEPVLATMKIVRTIVVTLAGAGVITVGSIIGGAVFAREMTGVALRWILGL